MRRVALTGGIGSGKSYVLARLAACGVPTIDADVIVHDLLGPGTPVAAAIAARFGPAVMLASGGVDRRVLARLVFADVVARTALEQIVHPSVYDRIDAWALEREREGAPWCVADIPLLFETHRERDFDLVVVAACDPAVQLRRVMARDGIAEADARARLAAQWPIEEKVARADYVIDTSGRFEATDRQIDQLIAGINGRPRTRD